MQIKKIKFDPEEYKNNVTIFLYHGVRVITFLAFIIFLIDADWVNAFYTAIIFLLIIAPSTLQQRYNLYLPFELDLAIGVFVFLTVFLGGVQGYYTKLPHWDSMLHFQSGFLLGLLGFVIVYILNKQTKKKINLTPGFISFFSVCFSLALAAVWEIFEFIVDSTLGTNWQESGIPDTMGDLIVNGIGSLIVAVLAYFWMRRRLRLPFTSQRIEADETVVKK